LGAKKTHNGEGKKSRVERSSTNSSKLKKETRKKRAERRGKGLYLVGSKSGKAQEKKKGGLKGRIEPEKPR